MLQLCQSCGFNNEDKAIFCAECGVKIEIIKEDKITKISSYCKAFSTPISSFFKMLFSEVFVATRFFTSPIFYLLMMLFFAFFMMIVYTLASESIAKNRVVQIKELEFTHFQKAEPLSWKEAQKYCENLTYSSKDNWRLPDKEELKILYHSKKAMTYYLANNYWTTSHYPHDKLGAWRINFDDGSLGYYSKISKSYVRCVRDK